MLEKAKLALRIMTDAFDEEILLLMRGAIRDLEIAGIIVNAVEDENDVLVDDVLIQRAIITYVRANFGAPEEYERLKASYDEQKAQLQYAEGYREQIDG